MDTFSVKTITRKNILEMLPYSCARDEFDGEAGTFLDANENPFNTDYNRYPDPHQKSLKQVIAKIKQISPSQIFLGNGSDEAIDLPFRAFCEPGVHNVVAMHPSYGMYEVAANTNGVEYRKVLLDENYQLNVPSIFSAVDQNTRIIFLCSPNNPTGNDLNPEAIKEILNKFKGLVVIDEAYIDFSERSSYIQEIENYPNLMILQTFSKAYGLAGLRLGMAFAQTDIIEILNKIKYPYNINVLTQKLAMDRLLKSDTVRNEIQLIRQERERMREQLATLPFVKKIFPSQANFLLVQFENGDAIYKFLIENSIITRNRSRVALCDSSVRITIGIPSENQLLIEKLRSYKSL